MKKILMMTAVALTAFSLSGCGGSSSSSTSNGTGTVVMPETTPEETNPENGLPLSKQPDETAPVLASIVVYVPNDDGVLVSQMEASVELSEENILLLLKENKIISEDTSFVSLEKNDSGETLAAGPGQSGGVAVQNGVVTLSNFAPAEGVSEELAKEAVTLTFRDNYAFRDVELVLE